MPGADIDCNSSTSLNRILLALSRSEANLLLSWVPRLRLFFFNKIKSYKDLIYPQSNITSPNHTIDIDALFRH